jgi:hypothetical protein
MNRDDPILESLSEAFHHYQQDNRMDEKLPAPCERSRASGLRHGSVSDECQGKGYRLFISRSETPEPLKRPQSQWRGPRPPQRQR